MPEPSPTGVSCVSASASMRPAPGPARVLLGMHLPKVAAGVLWSPWGAHRCVTPTHHHQDITIMASPWKPPLGHPQQVIPTTRTSPPGLHHWLLVLHVPKAFTGGCADPLELPSSWLGRRFPIGYKRSQACSRAWCHLGVLHWAAPKLLPQVMAQATCG